MRLSVVYMRVYTRGPPLRGTSARRRRERRGRDFARTAGPGARAASHELVATSHKLLWRPGNARMQAFRKRSAAALLSRGRGVVEARVLRSELQERGAYRPLQFRLPRPVRPVGAAIARGFPRRFARLPHRAEARASAASVEVMLAKTCAAISLLESGGLERSWCTPRLVYSRHTEDEERKGITAPPHTCWQSGHIYVPSISLSGCPEAWGSVAIAR